MRWLPEKSAEITTVQSTMELIRRRKNIFAFDGGNDGVGSDMTEKLADSPVVSSLGFVEQTGYAFLFSLNIHADSFAITPRQNAGAVAHILRALR